VVSPEQSISRRIDLLRLGQRPDPYLAFLITLGEGGARLPIGLVVGHTMVRGAIATDIRFAEALDGAMAVMAQASGGTLDSSGSLDRAFVRSAQQTEERRKAGFELLEGLGTGLSIDDIAPDNFRSALEVLVPVRSFTLADAQVLVSQAWVDIGVMRISIDHVAAWWPLEEQAKVKIDYHFEPRAETGE